MWKPLIQKIGPGVTGFRILNGEKKLSFSKAIEMLSVSPEFRTFFVGLLKGSPFEGYFWEVKPVSVENMKTNFEFVLVNSPILPTIQADFSAFSKYFTSGEPVVSFPNLSGDATLIVPSEESNPAYYAHLAAFVRNAPPQQVDQFWKRVAEEFANAVGEQPKWLSTAGLGVSWLHVRIDSTPKYYRYVPYRKV